MCQCYTHPQIGRRKNGYFALEKTSLTENKPSLLSRPILGTT